MVQQRQHNILMILVHLKQNKTKQTNKQTNKKPTVRIGSGAKTQCCIVAAEGGKLGNKAGFRPLQLSGFFVSHIYFPPVSVLSIASLVISLLLLDHLNYISYRAL